MIGRRDTVASLEKGLQVIEAFESAASRLTLTEVAIKVGITRAAARRLLLTLAKTGYAGRDGRYFSLTPKVLGLGQAHLSGSSISRIAQPFLEIAAGKTMESASAGMLAAADVVFVARAASPRSVSIQIAVGTRVPAFCTAMGRVLYAEMPEPVVRELLVQFPPRRLSAKTRISIEEILSEVRRTRDQGFAFSDGELEAGLKSIAIPVRQTPGATPFSIGLSAPAERMTRQRMVEDFLPVLNNTAAALRRLL